MIATPEFPDWGRRRERIITRIENKKEKSISVWIWVVQEISVIARRLQRICPKNDWGQRSSWGQIKLKGDVRVSRLTLELVQTGLREGRGARRPPRVPKSRDTKKNEFCPNRLFPKRGFRISRQKVSRESLIHYPAWFGFESRYTDMQRCETTR